MTIDLNMFVELLQNHGAWGLAVIAGAGYWLEKVQHDKTKERERERLLSELDYLNRLKNRGGNDE